MGGLVGVGGGCDRRGGEGRAGMKGEHKASEAKRSDFQDPLAVLLALTRPSAKEQDTREGATERDRQL